MKTTLEITKNTRVGVLCGGLSDEREVSLRSGKNCHAALQRLGYKSAELIDVGHDVMFELKDKKIEAAFLALHGKYGEDGTVQGLLELMQIPYTGSGVLSSALCMSKPLTKQVLSASKIPYAETVIINEHDADRWEEITAQIKWAPAMVKPLAGGSSVGVQKVDATSSLATVVKETVTNYGGAIIERYITGQEITIGVLENTGIYRNGTPITALPILELRPKSAAGFYDYEAKYTKGMTEFILPAELSPEVTKSAQELAVRTFRAMCCSGYARVDMIVDAQGQPFVLEVNSLPGMTDTSDLPAMAEKAGIGYDALVERILMSCSLDK